MNETKHALVNAVMKLLRPLVRILIRYGISHREFSDLMKKLYVDVAFKHFAIPGKKLTMSRVAVLTGLGRKEVVKVSFPDPQDNISTQVNRAIRVIGGWMQDADFLDDQGKPRILPVYGDHPSFEALVKKFGGDISPSPVLDELLRTQCVERLESGSVKLCKPGYMPEESDAQKLAILGSHGYDFMDTLRHNLEHPSRARFQRQVAYNGLDEHVYREFEGLSGEQAMELLQHLNKWLAEKKKAVSQTPFSGDRERFGLGIYLFRGKSAEQDSPR